MGLVIERLPSRPLARPVRALSRYPVSRLSAEWQLGLRYFFNPIRDASDFQSKARRDPASQQEKMSNRITLRTRNDSLSSHILPVSGTMIGVCVTLIGLVKLAEARHGTSHVDEYAALAAITFLASALTSYLSMRYADREKLSVRIERLADTIFLWGLVGITLVATLFAYEVI